jgi:hypothetical protein
MDREQQRHKWRERKARQREREKQVLVQAIENAGPPPTRAELLSLLGARARQGHVPAIRLLLEEYRRDDLSDETPNAAIDELARRRR